MRLQCPSCPSKPISEGGGWQLVDHNNTAHIAWFNLSGSFSYSFGWLCFPHCLGLAWFAVVLVLVCVRMEGLKVATDLKTGFCTSELWCRLARELPGTPRWPPIWISQHSFPFCCSSPRCHHRRDMFISHKTSFCKSITCGTRLLLWLCKVSNSTGVPLRKEHQGNRTKGSLERFIRSVHRRNSEMQLSRNFGFSYMRPGQNAGNQFTMISHLNLLLLNTSSSSHCTKRTIKPVFLLPFACPGTDRLWNM